MHNVTNVSNRPLGLPGGPVIEPGTTVLVKNWASKESSDVVKSWLDAGALEVEAATVADTDNASPQRVPISTPSDVTPDMTPAPEPENVGKTKEELDEMKNGELAHYIESVLGGTVKTNAKKDELVAQALELQTAAASA